MKETKREMSMSGTTYVSQSAWVDSSEMGIHAINTRSIRKGKRKLQEKMFWAVARTKRKFVDRWARLGFFEAQFAAPSMDQQSHAPSRIANQTSYI